MEEEVTTAIRQFDDDRLAYLRYAARARLPSLIHLECLSQRRDVCATQVVLQYINITPEY
jgi:hypothetical protein